jgi:hypothetical protein
MANGKWQMANGKWQMANGKRPRRPKITKYNPFRRLDDQNTVKKR